MAQNIDGLVDSKIDAKLKYIMQQRNIHNEVVSDMEFTPEWFKAKSKEFPDLDEDANKFLETFRERFSVEKIQILDGNELLNTIFLNPDNKTNLCYVMEFDKVCRKIFGSIKNGTSFKYGLHYSQKYKTWTIGTGKEPKFLSEAEAIDLGCQIREFLVSGAKIIADFPEIKVISDYERLYKELEHATDGYINKVWFVKYYALLYPEIFPPIYSTVAQNKVLNKLNIDPKNNGITRIGQIREFVDQCDISNVMFNKIFWTYCNNDDCENEDDTAMIDEPLKDCFDIVRTPRIHNIFPFNFIVYGAPGTGKTYSMLEYALAIINNQSIEEFKETNTDRKENISKYKEYVKDGQIVFTTFHQNYGYEEFIQGLRPDTESEILSFKTVDGVFKRIADTALRDEDDKNFIIIIDEINRANISKVFGELITLIEDDKRWGELNEMSVTLQSGDHFAVPNNLYIVGTMNSADKSISLIDAALRRRFSFIEKCPDSSLVEDATLRRILENLNKLLVKELDSTDLLIGHSYFIGKTAEDLSSIMNNNIIPLLYEYFYDNRKKVAATLKESLDTVQAEVEIIDDKVGRLRIQKMV